jgi:hypothetical protein
MPSASVLARCRSMCGDTSARATDAGVEASTGEGSGAGAGSGAVTKEDSGAVTKVDSGAGVGTAEAGPDCDDVDVTDTAGPTGLSASLSGAAVRRPVWVSGVTDVELAACAAEWSLATVGVADPAPAVSISGALRVAPSAATFGECSAASGAAVVLVDRLVLDATARARASRNLGTMRGSRLAARLLATSFVGHFCVLFDAQVMEQPWH